MKITGGILRLARTLMRSELRREPGPTILLYHRIAEEPFDPWALAVSPTHFNEQMEWIGR